MPTYKYKALSSGGQSIQNTYTAQSRDEVIAMIRQKNHYPVSIEEVPEPKEVDLKSFFGPKVKTKQIAIFCRQFYTMLNAGVTLVNCVDILQNQTENKAFKEVLGEVYGEVQKGAVFSEVLGRYSKVFPSLLVNMVESGEATGSLDQVMNRMATHYEKENRIESKVRTAMIYPTILGIIAVLVVIFLVTVIMPTFIGMFTDAGVDLPLPTRILLGFSHSLKKYWYLWGSGTLGMILGFRYYLATPSGRYIFDYIKLHLRWVRGPMQKILTSRFTRTMSSLLGSGVPLIEALEIAGRVTGNKVVEKKLEEVIQEVRSGVSLAIPIKKMKVFPPMVTSMIQIGEESGSLDEILDKTANFYDDELETAIAQLLALIEPVMILLMAVIIGFIVIAMMLPIFDLFQTIQV